jgi:hypothetical protein
MRERDTVFRISNEVDLVYAERMRFGGLADNAPMLISAYASACRRTCSGLKLAAMDVEAVLVSREPDNEVRCTLLLAAQRRPVRKAPSGH